MSWSSGSEREISNVEALQIVPFCRSSAYFLMLPGHSCWFSRGLKSAT